MTGHELIAALQEFHPDTLDLQITIRADEPYEWQPILSILVEENELVLSSAPPRPTPSELARLRFEEAQREAERLIRHRDAWSKFLRTGIPPEM